MGRVGDQTRTRTAIATTRKGRTTTSIILTGTTDAEPAVLRTGNNNPIVLNTLHGHDADTGSERLESVVETLDGSGHGRR